MILEQCQGHRSMRNRVQWRCWINVIIITINIETKNFDKEEHEALQKNKPRILQCESINVKDFIRISKNGFPVAEGKKERTQSDSKSWIHWRSFWIQSWHEKSFERKVEFQIISTNFFQSLQLTCLLRTKIQPYSMKVDSQKVNISLQTYIIMMTEEFPKVRISKWTFFFWWFPKVVQFLLWSSSLCDNGNESFHTSDGRWRDEIED